ncbi:hypothetical protein [Streptomyces sp. Ru71]|uniref:hypothetical protein n=1 Tax=Streptomyces sp. Ru71 TaxID=2080746 RepID=UPI0015E42FED|nr:hypothetical protein [Streptomyces sp. Ru71]
MKRGPAFGAASVILFVFGFVFAILYVADLTTGGDGPRAFIESACALLAGSWLAGLLHTRQAAKRRR